MWGSIKAFFAGPVGALGALAGVVGTGAWAYQSLQDSHDPIEPWRWLTAGLLGLVLLSFWRFHQTYTREPRLRVYFDEGDTYDEVPVAGFGPSGGLKGFFTHVKVENENGNVRARECKGRLTRWEERQPSGEFTRHSYVAAPIVIKWANEDYGRIDIEPGESRRLDLVHSVQSLPDRMMFHTQTTGQGVLTNFPPGVYRAEIRVSGENAREASGWFEIDFRDWNQINVKEAS